MAATLLGAVFARFQGDAALAAAVPGSPFLDEAPENTALPYVVISEHSQKPAEHTTEPTYLEHGRFTLTAYGVGEAAVEAIGALILAAFDEVPLEVTGARPVRCQRLDYRVRLDRMRSSLAQRVIGAAIPYEAWIERTY